MPTCFVIQPFDSKFDKRYDDIFRPALEKADLNAYRVDRDPSVEVPIDAIEESIRNATICLADITTDNPNVWYELGYAFAADRSVILVCSDERTKGKFPFDIQHRTVIQYGSESSSDFEALGEEITKRAEALIRKNVATRRIMENEPLAAQEGLSQIEILVLAIAAAETVVASDSVSAFQLKRDAERSGLTAVGFALALRRLQRRGFVKVIQETDHDGSEYQAIVLEDDSWTWIDDHESLFSLTKGENEPSDFDDDIPF